MNLDEEIGEGEQNVLDSLKLGSMVTLALWKGFNQHSRRIQTKKDARITA